jgi:hypothetical protein
MTVRFSHLLRARAPRAARGTSCGACGESVLADDHAIQHAGGLYHAGCVLYQPRPQPELIPPARARLRATR